MMNHKAHVSVREIVNDIRSGMPDHDLMAKHKLSSRGLQRAYEKLVNIGALTREEVLGRVPTYDDTVFFSEGDEPVTFEDMRSLPRHFLVFPIAISDVGSYPESIGRVRDITEKGLGILGIDAVVNETKSFMLLPNDFADVGPISFKAVCRWINKGRSGEVVGGFQITEISDESSERLRNLIQELTFGGAEGA
jgi:hypothetical protein